MDAAGIAASEDEERMEQRSTGRLAAAVMGIGRDRATGALRITSRAGSRMAFFEDGALVYLVSDCPDDSLAAFLGAPGRLGAGETGAALGALCARVTRSQSLPSLVLESGLCGEATLREWLTEYACACFARAAAAPDAAERLASGVRAPHPVTLAVPADRLVLEAAHRMDEDLARELLGPLSNVAEPADDHFARIVAHPLNYQEGAVGSQLSGRMSLDELIAVSSLPEADAVRALLALRLVGVLEPFAEPKEMTHTGRLRMRLEALETGLTVDVAAAAAMLGIAPTVAADEEEAIRGDAPFSPGEWEAPADARTGAPARAAEPTFVAPAPGAALAEKLAPRRRGNTGQLRVLSSAYVDMARAEAAAGNFNGAVQCYESALRESPNDLEVVFAFADLLASRPNGTSFAEKLLFQACASHPRKASPRVALVKLYRAAGRPAQAASMLAEARSLEPRNPEVLALAGETTGGGGGGGLLARMRGRGSSPGGR